MGINYGEINQVIQKKFLYREIYELDREPYEIISFLEEFMNYIMNSHIKINYLN